MRETTPVNPVYMGWFCTHIPLRVEWTRKYTCSHPRVKHAILTIGCPRPHERSDVRRRSKLAEDLTVVVRQQARIQSADVFSRRSRLQQPVPSIQYRQEIRIISEPHDLVENVLVERWILCLIRCSSKCLSRREEAVAGRRVGDATRRVSP